MGFNLYLPSHLPDVVDEKNKAKLTEWGAGNVAIAPWASLNSPLLDCNGLFKDEYTLGSVTFYQVRILCTPPAWAFIHFQSMKDTSLSANAGHVSGCVPRNSLIVLPSGDQARIFDLRPGDVVLGIDYKSGLTSPRIIRSMSFSAVSSLWTTHLDQEDQFRSSGDQFILTTFGPVRVRHLRSAA